MHLGHGSAIAHKFVAFFAQQHVYNLAAAQWPDAGDGAVNAYGSINGLLHRLWFPRADLPWAHPHGGLSYTNQAGTFWIEPSAFFFAQALLQFAIHLHNMAFGPSLIFYFSTRTGTYLYSGVLVMGLNTSPTNSLHAPIHHW